MWCLNDKFAAHRLGSTFVRLIYAAGSGEFAIKFIIPVLPA